MEKPNLRIFNFICSHLGDLLGEPVIGKLRFDLWTDLSSSGYSPIHNADPVRAASCLEAADSLLIRRLRETLGDRAWRRFLKQVSRVDPTRETPEEIFARLGEA